MPRLLVAAALVGETAYSDLPQTMVELMRLVQQGDAFAREHIHDFKQSRGNQAGDSPWSIIGDGLLRFKGCVYISKDHAVREEFCELTTTISIASQLNRQLNRHYQKKNIKIINNDEQSTVNNKTILRL